MEYCKSKRLPNAPHKWGLKEGTGWVGNADFTTEEAAIKAAKARNKAKFRHQVNAAS